MVVPIVTLAGPAREECDCTHSARIEQRPDAAPPVARPTQTGVCGQFEPIAPIGDEWRRNRTRTRKCPTTAIREMPDDARTSNRTRFGRCASSLLLLTTAQMVFVVALTVFVIRHMNPLGDGMEFVAVSAAILLLEVPFTIPAFILAVTRQGARRCRLSRRLCHLRLRDLLGAGVRRGGGEIGVIGAGACERGQVASSVTHLTAL